MGRKFSITFAASRPGVLVVETVPRGQVIDPGEISDSEADSLWTGRKVQATAPADGEPMLRAIFGTTSASTPAEAKELGW